MLKKQQIALKNLALKSACLLLCLWLPLSMISCSKSDNDSDIETTDLLFKNSVTINKPGRFLELPHKAEYLPNDQSNFLFFFWFTLKSIPADGERLVLVSKYSGQPPNIAGYAIALKREGSMLRPVVFWGDGTKAGRWLDFPEIKLISGEWNFLAMQVHKGNFIGLYHFQKVEAAASSLAYLGSHELEIKAGGEAEMLFGAPQGRDFKGKLGPFGIVNPFKFRVEEVQDILSEYLKRPEDFSVFGDSRNMKLLVIDGRKDQAENPANIKTNLKFKD